MRIYWEILNIKYLNRTWKTCQSKSCFPYGAGLQQSLLRFDSSVRVRCRAWPLGGGRFTADRRMLWEAVWDTEGVTSNALGHLGWNKFKWKIFLLLMRTKHSRAARAAEAAGRQWIRPEPRPASPSQVRREKGHWTDTSQSSHQSNQSPVGLDPAITGASLH